MGFGPSELILIAVGVVTAFFIFRMLTRRRGAGASPGPSLKHRTGGEGQARELPSVEPSPAPRPKKVFVSYRREDSGDVAGRIYDRLLNDIDDGEIFKDVDSVPFGVDFRRHLDEAVGNCDVMIVVIGDRWLTETDAQGGRRLDQPNDFVRIEIESALRRDIPVIPVLVKRAAMPAAGDLPDTIKELAFRNGIEVRVDPDFHNDMNRLVAGLGLDRSSPH